MSDELIEVHGKAKKLSKHLHLPVQSGSATVLQRMLREYTPEHYLGLLEKLRASNPDIVISTDIIAGFPNETDEEHKETLDLLDKAKFDFIYSYAYSERAKTRAAKIKDNLSDDVRGYRLREIQAYQLKIQAETRSSLAGTKHIVLVESFGMMGGIKKWKGRTNCNRIVHFVPENEEMDYKWHWVEVEINSATALSCQGTFLKNFGRRLSNNK